MTAMRFNTMLGTLLAQHQYGGTPAGERPTATCSGSLPGTLFADDLCRDTRDLDVSIV